MIKCDVTVCGIVSRGATMRTDKEGRSYTAFALNVVIPARSGINKTIEVSVTKDGGSEEQLADYAVGQRLEVAGTLYFNKQGEELRFNLSASSVNFATTATEDSIKGTMQFRGKTGKSIEENTDKKGNPYTQFSAFSASKVADGFEYVWVRFIQFGKAREPWLQPATHIEASGELELSVYNDNLNIGCKVAELSEYIKPPYNSQN